MESSFSLGKKLKGLIENIHHDDQSIDIPPSEYHYIDNAQYNPYDYTSPLNKRHMLNHAKQLELEFQKHNPTLLHQLKKAMSDHDYAFLLKKLAQGSFWAAALISQPHLIGPGLLLRHFIKKTHYNNDKDAFIQKHMHDY